ncbi:DNA polymerase III subunit gamma and tau [Arthrobacter sp. CAN_C5]|uniref:DNA polymerase III subunit gamma and tau n=1 Tax=Arthrobacter sp. CAN_C5 TaxID=2760706 RepID=UPI001AE395A5|nr:DNA polymerase III subunit gamma and tau [Arthrobacter sp. CAN_C5]MBP2218295.1 DNA polymerase-3 subunit gamma/tau [Arthrobacter sp. CAN_C5]
MSTALYRRYRPEAFADVIGQEHVTAPLMAAIEKGRVNHAYLFSGPRGCGKTTSARILARCLNCAQGPTPVPCGVCDSCVELARGGSGSLDVIEIDAASHGGVDDARDLRERATFAPVRDRYKIFIIDEAHMVTSAGFNALLKIVEEPPEHIKFIFATTEPDKVIGTIRSRTHHYPFRLVPPEPLMGYLDLLCTQEGIPVVPGVLSLVIRAGGGSVRDSLSVLDQLMAGAGPDGLDYELAVSLLGYTHASLLDDVVDAFAAGDAGAVFSAVDRVIQTGHDPRRFVEDLLERFRDLIIVNAVPDSAAAILRGTPDDQLNRMRTQANQMGRGELSRAADITNTALTEMTGATSPRLHLELLCARILLPAADETERGTLARVDRIERRLQYAGSDAVPAAAPTAPAPAREPDPGAADRVSPEHGAPDQGVPERGAPERGVPAVTAPGAGAAPREPTTPPAADAVDPGPTQDNARPAQDDAAWPDESSFAGSAPGSTGSAPAAPTTPAPAAGTSAQAEPAPTAAGAPQVEMIRRAWPEIMDELARIKRTTWLNVNPDAKPRTMNGNQLVLAFATQGNAIAFQRGTHMDNVKQAIHKILALDVTIDVVHDGAAAAGEPNPKVPTSRQAPTEPPSSSTPETRRVEPAVATPRPASASPDMRSTEPPGATAPLNSPDEPQSNPAPVAAVPAAAPTRAEPNPTRQAPSAALPATVTPSAASLATVAPAAPEPATVRQAPSAATPATPAAVPPASAPEAVQSTSRPPATSSTAGHAPTTRWNTGPATAGNQSPAQKPRASPGPDARDGSGAPGRARTTRTAPPPDDSWASVEPPSDEYDLGPESTAWQTPEPTEAETWAPESAQPAPATPPATSLQESAPSRRADSGQRPEVTPPVQHPAAPSPEAAASAAKPLSRYQRLLDEAERKRQEEEAANPRKGAVDLTYVEDEPSADDVTIEESGLVGRSAIERILNGRLIEERGVDSP